MKFKKGDRVKSKNSYTEYGVQKGDIGTVIENSNYPFVQWDRLNRKVSRYEGDLELVEYTYEDLKKSPIGTKITFEDGTVLVKDSLQQFENPRMVKDLSDLNNLETENLGKITKIEEPTYETVYEAEEEILDEVEKRYLKGVIRPFRYKVTTIRKLFSPTREKYFIQVRYKSDTPTSFPYLDNETMYQGMKKDKEYTLEELGL